MRRSNRDRPSKMHSVFGLFIGLIFVAIGFFAIIPAYGPLGILWTFLAVFVIIVNGRNVFPRRDMSAKTTANEGKPQLERTDGGVSDTGLIDIPEADKTDECAAEIESAPETYARREVRLNMNPRTVTEHIINIDGTDQNDPEANLMELYRLYNRHLITEEEYNKKRIEILKISR